jgi:nicotinamide mononucleotide adenylyltransferase
MAIWILLHLNMSASKFAVLVAGGSFNPITFAHLRMFEMAKDHLSQQGIQVLAGFISPVSDAYKKKGLLSATHRVAMCKLATLGSTWIQVDSWEAEREEYTGTLDLLKHVDSSLKTMTDVPVVPMFLAGTDLVETFKNTDSWDPQDVHRILLEFGCVTIERGVTNLMRNDRPGIHHVPQTVPNDISSTRVRDLLYQGMSVKYLIPDKVLEYIKDHSLYTIEQTDPINS